MIWKLLIITIKYVFVLLLLIQAGVVKDYIFQGKDVLEEDMLVLRAYLKAKLITQIDYDGQRETV